MKIIYDGDCPFCAAYVRMTRLKRAVGDVELVNARDMNDADINELTAKGFNLDSGMIVVYEGEYYHGHEAIHMIALMTTEAGPFNRVMGTLFKNKKTAKCLYPFLVTGRNLALFLLGHKKIHT
mgnify:CR=1 FL=1